MIKCMITPRFNHLMERPTKLVYSWLPFVTAKGWIQVAVRTRKRHIEQSPGEARWEWGMATLDVLF